MTLGELATWAGLLQFVAGLVVAVYGTLFSIRWPHRVLWRHKPDAPATICLATSAKINTGKYIRPTTGLGQVQALAAIVPSMLVAYGPHARPNVTLSDDVRGELLKKDLVLLGGAKNNEYTRRVFDEFFEKTTFNYVDDLNTIVFEGETLTGVTRDDKVVQDWAIIMRVPNPYSNGATTVTILAGVHTHGVQAAAEYFVNHMRGWRGAFRKYYICLVKVEVVESETVRPRRYKIRGIKK